MQCFNMEIIGIASRKAICIIGSDFGFIIIQFKFAQTAKIKPSLNRLNKNEIQTPCK